MSCKIVRNKNLSRTKLKTIILAENKWNKLIDCVNRNEIKAKEIAEELKNKEERKICSEEMAKKWDNTYLNLRKKRLEDRRLRLEREKNRKYERFLRIQKEKEKLKEEVREEGRRRLYEEQDAPKAAISAYKFAETLRERKLQIDFNTKLKEIEEERDREYVKKVYDDVKKYNEEEAEKKVKALETKRRLKKENLEGLWNNAEQRRKEKERLEAEEREDLENIKKEIMMIEENEHNENERRKCIVRKELLENRQILEENRKILAAEEQEENEALRIIANAKMRMGKIRKEKEAQMIADSIKRKEKIASAVSAVQESKDTKEREIYRKARAQKDAIELKRLEDDIQHIFLQRQERIDYHKEFLRQEELYKKKNHELNKWNMLQRFKSAEVDKAFKDHSREIMKKKMSAIREENLIQIEELNKKKREENEFDTNALKRADELWKMEDQKFFNFVEELKKDCVEVKRPVFPLDRVLCDYKKRTGLLEKPIQPKIWKSNLPIVDAINKPIEKRVQHRYNYSKTGNSKTCLAAMSQQTPINFVKDLKGANGLQDEQRKNLCKI